MNQDEREERKVNWTTPQKLEEGRSTDESRAEKQNRCRTILPVKMHPGGKIPHTITSSDRTGIFPGTAGNMKKEKTSSGSA